MSDKSAIEWTDATWNPVRGCSRITTGCGGPNHEGGCYAEKIAARFSDPGQPFHGFAERTPHGGRWTGKLALIEDQLTLPLRWKKPRKIFVNSMSDLFHENLSDADIDRVFAVMAMCPQHTFQVLTKRSARMHAYMNAEDRAYAVASALGNMLDGEWIWNEGKKYRKRIERMISALHGIEYVGEEDFPDGSSSLGDEQQIETPWPLPNVWLGVSAERQEEADERIPLLLDTPAAVRFVSAEPLLAHIHFGYLGWPSGETRKRDGFNALIGCRYLNGDMVERLPKLDWIIVGGESGPRSREFDLAWARSIIAQCHASDVKCFVKQLGARVRGPHANGVNETRYSFKHSKGGDWNEWPEDLRVREFPVTDSSVTKLAGTVVEQKQNEATPS